MCNAGIMALPELEQAYGLELQFVTNHLGHYLLIRHLLDQVIEAPAGRIVLLSSAAHNFAPLGGIQFSNLSGEKGYSGWKFYGQSKLANLLTANELARRLRDTTATANSLHPGIIQTNLGRHFGGGMAGAMKLFSPLFERSVEQGAATQCYVATSPQLEGVSGKYFADCNRAMTSRYGRNSALAARLWEVSEELLVDYLPQ
jgi:WW domain-containing oxidoreductase